MSLVITTANAAPALAALFNASRPLGMGFTHPAALKPMSTEDAQKELDAREAKEFGGSLSGEHRGIYFDYLNGRVMKLDFNAGKALDFRLFDRDNGQGAGERAVAELV